VQVIKSFLSFNFFDDLYLPDAGPMARYYTR